MRLPRTCHVPKHRLRLPFIGLAVLLSACQFGTPAPAPDAQLLPAANTSTGASGDVAAPAKPNPGADAPQLTYTIQRGTLHSSLALSGKVVPTRTAQLSLRGGGTVTAVRVRPGQSVKEGDPLIEFALDYDSLQNARTQATLAELAYETEQAKLDQLNAGADKAPLEQLNAQIAKDRAEIQKLELERDTNQSADTRAQQSRAVARESADRKVALAQVSLQSAQDALDDAKAVAQRAQDNAQLLQAKAKNDADNAIADAQSAADAATAAVRAAERRVQESTAQLAHAQLLWNGTKANQEIANLKLRVQKDQQDMEDAKALQKAAQTRTEAVAADNAAHSASRALSIDQLALDQAQSNLGAAQLSDDSDIKAASIALEQAKDDLATAQAAQQRAQQKVARLSQQAQLPLPSATIDQLDPQALEARVHEAEHKVEIEQINLQEAQSARAALDVPDPRTQFADLSIEAAKAQLDADAARVAQLQSGTSGDEVHRQETRVALLKDQATAAAAAAQPVVVLKAPFDATVTDVGVTDGQTISPQVASNDAAVQQTAAGLTTGQTTDGRQVAVRLAGAGTTSIVAQTSETDVNQLSVGQAVSLTFPGLPGQDASGTISEIAAAPTVQGTTVSYPVRVDVPDAPPQLKVGMSVQLTADVEEAKDVLVAPLDAIRTIGGQSLVGKIDSNGVVTDVPVNVGRTAGLTAELTSGVKEGDVVALYTQATASSVR